MEGSEIYGIEKQGHAAKIRVSHVVSLLKLIASKRDPKGLGCKINPQVEVREKEYNQSMFFLLNPPTNIYPNVPKKSKHKHPIT